MPPKKGATSARLSPFTRGTIYGIHLMDATLGHTAGAVLKTDGTHPTQQCVSQCIALCEANGGVIVAAGPL